MSAFFQHLRFAARLWNKSRLTAAVVVLTVALCVGANVAVFSAVYGVLLRPLDLPEGDRLLIVYNSTPGAGMPVHSLSFPDYLDRRAVEAFAESTCYAWGGFALTGEGEARALTACLTTHTFFDTLDVQPALGTGWREEHNEEGNHYVAVLSHNLWQTSFGGAPDIVGRTIMLDQERYTVRGVMPQEFGFPSRAIDLWTPHRITPEMRTDDARGSEYLTGIARMRPDATVEHVRAQLDAIQAANAERMPNRATYWERNNFSAYFKPYLQHTTEDEAPLLWLVQAVALFVLGLGFFNVAGLFITQTIGRRHELSVRAAVGANWRQLWTQLTTEALGIMTLGGLLGLGLAALLIEFLTVFGFDELSRASNIGLSLPVVGAAGALVLLLGFLLGTAQTLYVWRRGLASVLQTAATRTSTGRSPLRAGLVVMELGVAVVLLVGAAILTQSFFALVREDPGYSTEGVVYGRMRVPETMYPAQIDRAQFYARLGEAVAALPGVQAAGFSQVLPFSGSNWGNSYDIEGVEPEEGRSFHANLRIASPGYFEALGLRLVEGRFLEFGDGGADGRRAVLVNRFWAEKYAPGASAVGRRLAAHGYHTNGDEEPDWREIVGVVEDVRFNNLTAPLDKETLYLPLNDDPVEWMSLVARAQPGVAPMTLFAPLREALADLDPSLPFFSTGTLQGYLDRHVAGRRAAMSLVVLSGGLALILALTGLYAMLAFAVRERRREIGVRMALGAAPAAIFQQFGREGFILIGLGLALGVGGALGLAQLIRNQVHGISPTDPTTLTIAATTLALCAAAALIIPTTRAMQTNPAIALREG